MDTGNERLSISDLVPPDTLDDVGRSMWHTIIAENYGGLLQKNDLRLLEALCLNYSRWVDTELTLAKQETVVIAGNGTPILNPLLVVATQTLKNIQSISRQLGLADVTGRKTRLTATNKHKTQIQIRKRS